MAIPRERVPPTATTRFELEFGDGEFVVTEFSDGMWAIEVDGYRLIVNTEQMQTIVGGIARIGSAKGWT